MAAAKRAAIGWRAIGLRLNGPLLRCVLRYLGTIAGGIAEV
jgi:hypothetical protein